MSKQSINIKLRKGVVQIEMLPYHMIALRKLMNHINPSDLKADYFSRSGEWEELIEIHEAIGKGEI